jgi:pimeloyl-ACP methyl ester carboxylesterase
MPRVLRYCVDDGSQRRLSQPQAGTGKTASAVLLAHVFAEEDGPVQHGLRAQESLIDRPRAEGTRAGERRPGPPQGRRPGAIAGPANLVCVPGFISNLYWNWELSEYNRMLTGLGSFARVAIMDRRGVGLSDRLSSKDLPSLEVVVDDILTVMDEAGIERAAVFGWQSGATHAALLAATYPDRVSQLVTFHLDPCPLLKPDWPYGESRGEWESYLSELRQGWGTREWLQQHAAEYVPSATSLTVENGVLAMFQLSANPATAEAVERPDMETDIRAVLPAEEAGINRHTKKNRP